MILYVEIPQCTGTFSSFPATLGFFGGEGMLRIIAQPKQLARQFLLLVSGDERVFERIVLSQIEGCFIPRYLWGKNARDIPSPRSKNVGDCDLSGDRNQPQLFNCIKSSLPVNLGSGIVGTSLGAVPFAKHNYYIKNTPTLVPPYPYLTKK